MRSILVHKDTHIPVKPGDQVAQLVRVLEVNNNERGICRFVTQSEGGYNRPIKPGEIWDTSSYSGLDVIDILDVGDRVLYESVVARVEKVSDDCSHITFSYERAGVAFLINMSMKKGVSCFKILRSRENPRLNFKIDENGGAYVACHTKDEVALGEVFFSGNGMENVVTEVTKTLDFVDAWIYHICYKNKNGTFQLRLQYE